MAGDTINAIENWEIAYDKFKGNKNIAATLYNYFKDKGDTEKTEYYLSSITGRSLVLPMIILTIGFINLYPFICYIPYYKYSRCFIHSHREFTVFYHTHQFVGTKTIICALRVCRCRRRQTLRHSDILCVGEDESTRKRLHLPFLSQFMLQSLNNTPHSASCWDCYQVHSVVWGGVADTPW